MRPSCAPRKSQSWTKVFLTAASAPPLFARGQKWVASPRWSFDRLKQEAELGKCTTAGGCRLEWMPHGRVSWTNSSKTHSPFANPPFAYHECPTSDRLQSEMSVTLVCIATQSAGTSLLFQIRGTRGDVTLQSSAPRRSLLTSAPPLIASEMGGAPEPERVESWNTK